MRVVVIALAVLSPLAAATLEIEAKLLQTTPTPEPEQVAPYPRALCTYLYKVRKVHAGSYADDEILVVKWAVWKKAKLERLPSEIGSIERLKLDRWIDHPEFGRERIVDAIGENDLVIYYDARSKPATGESPPEVRGKEAEGAVVRGGSAGWLFLADELRHVETGRFWEKDWKEVSRAGVDPLPAMLDFQRRLAALGTKLLIVPVPAKAAIYPEYLGRNIKVVPQAAFMHRLQQAGLNVLDLEPVFAEHRKDPANRPLYLAQDSHWSPEGCRVAAEAIFRCLRFPARNHSPRISMLPDQRMEIRGDLARMAGDTELPKESVTLDRVSYGDDGPVVRRSDPASPIVLLGDSHVTVFSEGTEELHGAGGGLPDYLLMRLGFPVDVIASHGDGVHQARVNLYRHGAPNPQARGYWENKKWVVWVFAAREFTRAERWSTKIPVVPPAKK